MSFHNFTTNVCPSKTVTRLRLTMPDGSLRQLEFITKRSEYLKCVATHIDFPSITDIRDGYETHEYSQGTCIGRRKHTEVKRATQKSLERAHITLLEEFGDLYLAQVEEKFDLPAGFLAAHEGN